MFGCPKAGKNLPGPGAKLGSKDVFLLKCIMPNRVKSWLDLNQRQNRRLSGQCLTLRLKLCVFGTRIKISASQ